MNKILLIILLLAFAVTSVSPECLACFELRGVRLKLSDGFVWDAYILFPERWELEEEKGLFNFPEDILVRMNDFLVRFYDKSSVFEIAYPKEGSIVSTSHSESLNRSEIISIVVAPGPYDGQYGATRLDYFESMHIELLKKKPVDICPSMWGTGGSDVTWISYDSTMTGLKLREFDEKWPNSGLDDADLLNLYPKLIRLEQFWD